MSVPPHILVVDDEPTIRDILRDFLVMEGLEVTVASDGETAVSLLASREFDVVVTDLKMREIGGIEVLEATRARWPNAAVVLMTGYGTVEVAIEAMKKGAFDFLLKPFKAPDLVRVVRRALDHRHLQIENVQLKELVDVYDVTQAMSQTLSLPEAFDLLVETTREQLQACAISVLVHPRVLTRAEPPRHGKVRNHWVSDASVVDELEEVRFWSRPDLSAEAIEACRTLDQPRVASHFEADQPVLYQGAEARSYLTTNGVSPGLERLVSLPLRGRDGLIGIVTAFSFHPNPRFSEGRRKLLHILASRAEAALENARLHEGLKATLTQTIQGLANILESKDPYTRGHSERVKLYAGMIAEGMGFAPEDVRRIEEAALLHDIGKICIRIEELNKPGPLSLAEYEMFKSHTTRGKWLLEPIAFLHPVIPAVYHHHERWDGGGYPMGLAGTAIPLDARIMAVADSYDAMTSNRPYRRALSHEVAVKEIRQQLGAQFDPEVAAVFLREIDRMKSSQRERRRRWVDILEAKGKRPHIPGYTDVPRESMTPGTTPGGGPE